MKHLFLGLALLGTAISSFADYNVWFTYDSAERIKEFYAPSGAFQNHVYDESSNRIALENSQTNAVAGQDQSAELMADGSVEITLGNSSDSFEIVSDPRHGTLGAVAGGKVIYSPENGYRGEDQFSYVVIRNGVRSGWITVNLDVNGDLISPLLPVVSISDPVSGVTFDFSETSADCSGTAIDMDGTVSRVEYSVNGGTWQRSAGTSLWQFKVYGLLSGTNSLAVRAKDSAGNYGDPSTVHVIRSMNLMPVVHIESPEAGATLESSQSAVLVSGSTYDSDGSVEAVQYRLNGGVWQDIENPGTSWSYILEGLQEWNNLLEMRAQDNHFAWSEVQSNTIHRTPPSPDQALIAQWNFNQNLKDSSGNSFDLSGSDLAQFDLQGWSGQAFVSTSGSEGICTETNTNFSTLPLSLSVWIKPSVINQLQKIAGVSNLWSLVVNDAGLPGVCVSNADYYANQPVEKDQWSHLMVTWSTNQTGVLYLNGEPLLDVPAWDTPSSVSPFCAGNLFDGLLDEINLWSSCLTKGQVLAEYSRVRGTVAASVLGNGIVIGAGTYYVGSEVVLQAIPDGGSLFKEWDDYDWNSAKEVLITEVEQAYVAEFTQGGGLLSVSVSLQQAVWNLTQYPQGYVGPLTGTGSVYSVSAPAGNYTVSFAAYAGYDAPASLSAVLDVDGNISLPGVYTEQTGGGGDLDGDGIPDSWETRYFSGATNAAPYVDSDGDGHDNLNEYIAGTNPTNRGSYFRVQLSQPSSAGFTVSWLSVEGRVYDVLWSPSLSQKFTVLRSRVSYPQDSYLDARENMDSSGFYKIIVRIAGSDNADADADGLPDSWELTYFSDTVSVTAEADSDQDGHSNLQEYLFGTDPTDQEDAQVFSGELSGGQMNLSLRSAERRWYTIEATDNLVNPDWIVLGRFFGTGSDMSFFDSDVAALPSQYYRIKAEVVPGDPMSSDGDGDGMLDMDDPEPFSKDSDHDGIPDAWEQGYSLSPSVSNAGLDSDNDGYSDYAEYVFGTHPDNSGSRFFWSATQSSQDNQWSFEVATASNRIYWVDYRSSMTASWSVIKRFGGNGETKSFSLTPPNGETGYFRVRATNGNVLQIGE